MMPHQARPTRQRHPPQRACRWAGKSIVSCRRSKGGHDRDQLYSVPVLMKDAPQIRPRTRELETIAAIAFLVEVNDALRREIVKRHLDHALGAVHDLWRAADHRIRLLAAQHRLRDLGRIGEVREPRSSTCTPALSSRFCSSR